MSSRQREKGLSTPGREVTASGRPWLTLSLLVAAGIAGLVVSWPPSPAVEAPVTPAALTEISADPPRQPDLRSLRGRWQRTDGDYVLDIRAVDDAGAVDVVYFNPGPIHVSQAKATRENSTATLSIELRDRGYPGCTYTLTYDPRGDRLLGTYFQAALHETFDIAFERLK